MVFGRSIIMFSLALKNNKFKRHFTFNKEKEIAIPTLMILYSRIESTYIPEVSSHFSCKHQQKRHFYVFFFIIQICRYCRLLYWIGQGVDSVKSVVWKQKALKWQKRKKILLPPQLSMLDMHKTNKCSSAEHIQLNT